MAGSIFGLQQQHQQQQHQQRQQHQLTKLMLVALLCSVGLATAKHLGDGDIVAANDNNVHHHHQQQHHYQHQQQHHEHQHQHIAATHHRRRLQRDSRTKDTAQQQQCEAVKGYFESIDIRSSGIYNEKGAICGGSCCNNATELELRNKASGKFEQLLHHHTSSLRGILETTASQFQSHVLELAEQSENKTLSVFSKVYRRMVPLSRKLIHQLYTEIINHLKYTSNYSNNNGNSILHSQSSLEDALHKFFEQLFPVAYHQAVHLTKDNYGELHEDYINCLKHNYDDLQPFGQIPKEIQANLLQSVHMSNIFMNALLQSAEVLSETDALYGKQLTDNCKLHLLKMHYCPNCNGHAEHSRPKVCYSYCMNVMRGCSAQYSGLLDSPWSNVVDALNNLVSTHILTDSGIMNTIKQLDTKLSEAIMRAMENGPELEKKVKATCGAPNLLPSLNAEEPQASQPHNAIKWSIPQEASFSNFLSTMLRSKEFFTNIVYNFCDDSKRDDHLCWTGDRVGDYTQLLMTPGTDTQRYNPEVPWENESQLSKLNELVDKLIKIRSSIGVSAPITNAQMHDIQSDMGHESSGDGHISDDVHISDDDEEYGGMHGSGDGSGGGSTSIYDAAGTTPITNDIDSRDKSKSASSALTATAISLLLTLVTLYSSCS